MSYNNLPERRLDPPEDTRKVVYRCRICDGAIREGDDYYDIPDRGPCCEECIVESKRSGAEADDDADWGDAAYDSMREEAMLDD